MKGLVFDIEESTEDNGDFRRVLYTGKSLQLVLMSLKPGQDIGQETHKKHDQFFRIEKGRGKVTIDGVTHKLKKGAGILVPAGAKHNLVNTGEKTMKLCTNYGPPNHVESRATYQVDGRGVFGAFQRNLNRVTRSSTDRSR